MKKIIFVLFCVSMCTTSFSKKRVLQEILEGNESSIDQRYYDLLPEIKEKSADIIFLRSRDPENMSLEESYIKMIARASKATTIVETGTYKGDSTEKMVKHFKQVHSIELGADLYEGAKQRFINNKNIRLYHGDSAQVLLSIIKQLKGKVVFFLDAHFSMLDTACGSENTPILTELEIIKKAGIKDSFIIIDDIRMFYKPPTSAAKTFVEGYPTVNNLVEKLLEINSSYKIAIVYDTLIAFCDSDAITVSPVVKATTMSRLYTYDNYLIDDILAAELCIAKTQNKEKEILIDLGQRWIEQWSYGTAISQHFALWYGLILMEQEEYSKALAYFEDAKKRGMYHWRLDWYMLMAQANCFFDIR